MSTIESLPKGWSEKPLGELLSFQNGANADGSAYGRGVKFANVLEVLENSHLKAKQIPGMVSVPKSVIQSFRLIRGDVLFNRTSETQDEVALASVYLDDSEAIFGGFVIRGRRKTNDLDPVWSGYGLRADRVRKQIVALSQGAVRANIGQENLGKVIVWLPPPEEQQAIAGVLSDLDSLIDSLNALIAKKRDLKQATMQQLLTGRKRLPGFAREWASGTLDSLMTFDDESLTCATSPDFTFDYISLDSVSRGVLEETQRVTFRNAPSRARRVVKPNDVLFGTVRPNLMSHLLVGEFRTPQIASTGFAVLRAKKHKCDPRFVFQWLFSRLATTQIDALLVGSSYPALNSKDVRSLKIDFPHFEEQKAIAEVLTDFDHEIDALIARRNKTQHLKTGLMQELLSGRRRLV